MRYIHTFGMVALTMALWSPGTTAAAQQVPSGSYQQTCQNIGVRGSTLYASCRNVNGGWQNTELQGYDRCNGQIENDNGNLRCTGGNGGYNGDNRNGDNRDRGYNGNNGNGDARDRDRDGDRDRNGNHGYGPNGSPNGSYVQTCQNIQMNGDRLQASCQKKNGKWKNTSLSNANRCNGDIQNDNGKLRCR
ncbi:MAG: CVNH domain-containing protein [Candidatus Angelobacter sp.]